MPIRLTVYGENLHEPKAAIVQAHCPSHPRLAREVTLGVPCDNGIIPGARFAAGKEAAK